MFELDHYANSGPLLHWPAGLKLGLGLLALLLAISVSHWALHLALLLALALLTVGAGRIPIGFYLRLYLVPASFILLSLLTVALTLTRSPVPLLYAVPLGEWRLGLSARGLEAATLLLTRSLAGLSASYFIALTTPVYQWASVLHRLKMPREFTELMILMYRFITIFAEEFQTMRQASELKFGGRNLRAMSCSAAALAGALLGRVMNSYAGWQRALELKLYQGDFHL